MMEQSKPEPYAVSLIGDYILAKGGGRFDQLQTIKLAFISYGHVLARYNRKLFNDDIEAWVYGPVVPALRETLKRYGYRKIDRLQHCRTPIEPANDDFIARVKFMKEKIDDDSREVIDMVVSEYGRLSGTELSDLTHMADTPWSQSYIEGGYHTAIPDKLIKGYYDKIESR